MKRITEVLFRRMHGLFKAVYRFPVSAVGFIATFMVVCVIIGEDQTPPVILQKLVLALVVGAILGMTLQFTVERFDKLSTRRMAVYGVGLLLTAGCFLILLPAPEISQAIVVRSLSVVFALIFMALWVPSANGGSDFNRIALVYFKSFATSWLYAAVLSAGFAALIASVDVLLFDVGDKAYAYSMALVWILFAPVYFLSLLPCFDHRQPVPEEGFRSGDVSEADAGDYPRFLEILVSYIAIPLVALYTAVLAAYFIKILVTQVWPSGQLGPMILVYSAAGLVVFVMASLLNNKFSNAYRFLFPKVLIPVVLMQLISVGIRLEAYGVTESRYYVALFGAFALAAGVLLSFSPVSKNGRIALLAAAFAVVSILPPVDAFTLSRNSQIGRLEKILAAEGILIGGKLVPKADASKHTKVETTNIVSYLSGTGGLESVEWLPADFKENEDFFGTFGFEHTYEESSAQRFASVTLDSGKPLDIKDFSALMAFNLYRDEKAAGALSEKIELGGEVYEVRVTRTTSVDGTVTLVAPNGVEVLSLSLFETAADFMPEMGSVEEMMPPEALMAEVKNDSFKMRVVFQSVNLYEMDQGEAAADYSFYVLVGDLRE